MDTFKELGLREDLVEGLDAMNIVTPTDIQAKAIPKLVNFDPDFIGLAQTGTGKTAAFGLPLINKVDESLKRTQALIVAPTRELAQQIAKELRLYSKFVKGLVINVVYGGTPVGKQASEVKKKPPQILVGTPGRLIDLVKRKAIFLDTIDTVVLDEADEMLKMGFQEEIDKILEHTPEDKATWLFSATMPKQIRRIVDKYMERPEEVTIDRTQVTNANISHQYVHVYKKNKVEALQRILDAYPDMYGVIFCKTRIETQKLANVLNGAGYNSEALHGELAQKQRDSVMYRLRRKENQLLVATDVAARGLDIEDLSHVIHFDLPDSMDYYTHRSGRTARAGKKGKSIILFSPSDIRKKRALENICNIKLEHIEVPKFSDLITMKIKRWANLVESQESEYLKPVVKELGSELFEDLSKEELILRLLKLEQESISNRGSEEDINLNKDSPPERSGRRDRDRGRGRDRDRGRGRDRDRGRGRDRDRGRGRDARNERGDRRQSTRRERDSDQYGREERGNGDRRSSRGEFVNIFIDVGKIDNVDKGSLLKYICKSGNLSRKQIGDINLHRRHSVFQLNSKFADDVRKMFQDATFKKRKLRVKVDE